MKENPRSTPAQIAEAQRDLDAAVARVTYVSEAALLARMNWWTIEYGLVGSLEDPKIYGAGLLSSVGESYRCLGKEVGKVPFSLDCIEVSYDITRPQPQLFVTPDFPRLTKELERLADAMAFRRGGREGLEKAKLAGTATTAVLDSGVQLSGKLAELTLDAKGRPIYLQYKGPTQLAIGGQEIPGHGAQTHREGFGAPLGAIKIGAELKSPAALTVEDIRSLKGRLVFDSGVVVEGTLTGTTPLPNGGSALLSFKDCKVSLGSRVLFDPAWGTFDLACGQAVTSVYGGAADRRRYLAETGGFTQMPNKPKTNLTERNRDLAALYGRIRAIRDDKKKTDHSALAEIHAELEARYPDDWLARFELLELAPRLSPAPAWAASARKKLETIAAAETRELIRRGLATLEVR